MRRFTRSAGASAFAALRSFSSEHGVSSKLPTDRLNKPMGGEHAWRKSEEFALEQTAAGQYHEHKPRAIMFVNKRPVEIIPQEENLLEVLEREHPRPQVLLPPRPVSRW